MASVTELWDSGVGDMTSDREGAAASRIFKVVVDAPTTGRREDPADFVLRSTSLAGRDAVPVGSPHPSGYAKDRAGLYAYKYTVEDKIAYLTYRVRVDYTVPLNFEFEPRTPWTMTYNSGFGTKRETRLTFGSTNEADWVDIGPWNYLPTSSETPPYTALDSTTPTGTQGLVRQSGRRIQPIDVNYSIGTMTLSRELRSYPPAIHSFLLALRTRTNDDTFLTRPPGKLKFVGPNVTSRIGLLPGMQTNGVIWAIELMFEDSDEGWNYVIQDTWINSKGEETAIRDQGGRIQWYGYTYYLSYNFGVILSTLNGYA